MPNQLQTNLTTKIWKRLLLLLCPQNFLETSAKRLQLNLENIASKKDISTTKLDLNGISARILQPDRQPAGRPDLILYLHQENATVAVHFESFCCHMVWYKKNILASFHETGTFSSSENAQLGSIGPSTQSSLSIFAQKYLRKCKYTYLTK